MVKERLTSHLNGNSWLLSGGIAMTKNNNCNDYTALGNYWINSNDVAITITNLPTPKAGTLKVESGVGITGSYILQTYRTYDGYEIWQRARSNLEQNGWYGWVQLMTSRILSLDCIKTTVSTVANTATTIPNSPTSKNYIPVVVGHENANNCLENIFWDNPNGWHIYTTVSQISSVWFYKYPE